MSNNVSFGKKWFKCFIGYKDTTTIKPLSILLLKMTAYRKTFNETKYISFLIKEFDGNPVYNKNIWELKQNHIMAK